MRATLEFAPPPLAPAGLAQAEGQEPHQLLQLPCPRTGKHTVLPLARCAPPLHHVNGMHPRACCLRTQASLSCTC